MTTAATSTPSAAQPGQNLPEPPRSFYDVPGWFYRTDVILFDWFLRRQRQLRQRGDLLEMGAYMGKSAVMMRAYLEHPDERFTVCDLFDSDAPDEANGREMRGSYATLTRRAFEANFLSFHDELPRIVQAPTTVVPQEVDADSCRFVHVDASHLYEHVYGDIQAARRVLRPDGLVVLDDYRSEHTPGSPARPGRRWWRAGCGRCASPGTSSTGRGGTPSPGRTRCTRRSPRAASAGCSGRRWRGGGCYWWGRRRPTRPVFRSRGTHRERGRARGGLRAGCPGAWPPISCPLC